MKVEIKTPDIGDAHGLTISKWVVKSGEIVSKNETIAEIESDKASITLFSPEAGKIEILSDAGYVEKGKLLAVVDTSKIHPQEKGDVHPTPFTVTINDGYCTWQYGFKLNDHVSIQDFIDALSKEFDTIPVYSKLIEKK